MTRQKAPTVFSIRPEQPFLPTVASTLCDGTLIDGFSYNGDPLCLSDVVIFVPTQRAMRELRSAFLDHLKGESVILPQIRTLGEFDEDAAFFQGDPHAFIKVPPPIDGLERQLLLGGLIADWNKHLSARLQELYADEELTTPVSTSDAFWLAQDLAALLDQLQTENLTFSDINAASAELDADGWWGVTLAFLQIIEQEWPAKLEELKRLDPSTHRDLMLRGEAARLKSAQPTTPVIVAGSTGTIPATVDLIKAIGELPAGAVILPGYDISMSAETKAQLEDPNDLGSAIGHPQYGMHHLILKMGAKDQVVPQVVSLGENTAHLNQRNLWVSAALEPAPQTANWPAMRKALTDAAFDNIAVFEAQNEREEAAGIAAALREAIADKDIQCALVTPDRMLARRVIAELAHYNIQVDDSGGSNFDTSSHGVLLGFVFAAVFKPSDAGDLLALLKNPLVQIGVDVQTHWHELALLERIVLRGGVGRFSLHDFHSFAQKQIAYLERLDVYQPKWAKTLTDDDRKAALSIALRLQQAFSPLLEITAKNTDIQLEQILRATVLVLEALCVDEGANHGRLYEGQAGQMLRRLLTQFLASDSGLSFSADQWPEIIRALTSTMSVKPEGNGHPRISIWGALEARLQTVDFLVMGGLNENVWPQQTSNDAFLTRGIKVRMGMQQPERRIGLSAHDFQMGMGQKRILLSRSVRQNNAPSVASRWVQRLETLAGADATKAMKARGQYFEKIVSANEKTSDIPLAKRAFAAPPIEARPIHFSVTEIERLRRDPYAVYAKKVLGLYPLEPLIRDPDAATRGTIIHKILEQSTKSEIDFSHADAPQKMRDIAQTVFDEEDLPEDIAIIWRLRFDGAIEELVRWENERSHQGVSRFAELGAEPQRVDPSSVTLSGRADRIDLNQDGSVDIIDFKTGGVPSNNRVKSMLAPQMPLEAALLKRGAFKKLDKRDANQLLYIKLDAKGNVDFCDVRGTGKNFVEADHLADKAWSKLVELIAFYSDVKNGYISRAIPAELHDFSGEYDHLARVLEWSSAVGESDGGESQ